MIVHKDCPLCHSTDITLQFTGSDLFMSGELFPVFRCRECGFIFTQSHPGEEGIGRYYESENYISHSGISRGIVNKMYLFARKFMLRKKVRLIKKSSGLAKGSLLDIGSGTGHFAAEAKKAGWDVRGVEISEKAREFSKLNFDLDVTANTSSLKDGSFDCITLWHVLEHFQDPAACMKDIHRLLKPEGTCIIALPNSDSFDAKYYKEYWAAWDLPRHLWHFSPEVFNKFSQNSGFEITGIKTLPMDVFYISIISEKYRKSAFSFIRGVVTAKWFFLLTIFRKKKASSLVYVMKVSKLSSNFSHSKL
jgi:SAM-dependent methyltransferase